MFCLCTTSLVQGLLLVNKNEFLRIRAFSLSCFRLMASVGSERIDASDIQSEFERLRQSFLIVHKRGELACFWVNEFTHKSKAIGRKLDFTVSANFTKQRDTCINRNCATACGKDNFVSGQRTFVASLLAKIAYTQCCWDWPSRSSMTSPLYFSKDSPKQTGQADVYCQLPIIEKKTRSAFTSFSS